MNVHDVTYIFDINSIAADEQDGEQKFIQEQKPFLSNSNITKIVYDSQLASNMLFHKYKVELNNVFDVIVSIYWFYYI